MGRPAGAVLFLWTGQGWQMALATYAKLHAEMEHAQQSPKLRNCDHHGPTVLPSPSIVAFVLENTPCAPLLHPFCSTTALAAHWHPPPGSITAFSLCTPFAPTQCTPHHLCPLS